MCKGFKADSTGSLQVQDIENEEVILSLHHAEHPIQSRIRLEGEIHRNHPTMTLQGNGEQEGSTVAWGSSATSNLSSADISFKRFADLVRSEIVNALIRRIEVHSKDKETKKVKVDIYFTAVGLFSIPTEKEIQAAMEEIRQNPQQFKFSA